MADDAIGEDLALPPTAAAAPSQAWLTVVDRPGEPMALAGALIRIGRHEDNDIRLPDWSVHRHHAVIERTPDQAFVIADVSGKDGSGLRVNGERTARARLADGDVIELGRAKLRFENAPV
jgi:pSer/pThr/pTyr-binding forkhead associated (FHA) protein